MKKSIKTTSFIFFLFGGLYFMSCGSGSEAPATEEKAPAVQTKFTEQHRPQFHFSPPTMWTNDPNGMVYFDGEYHLFYQHYPDSTVWGPMHWGHAVSTDLVHWEHLPIALYPDEKGYIFSGSAVVDWKNTSGLGQGGQPPLIAIFTYHDMVAQKAGGDNHESQAIAFSNDRGRTWTKYEGNPVIPNPGGVRDIRDPKVIWDDDSGQWVMVLAVGDHAEFWGSPNLKEWEKLSEFGKGLGNHGGVWECPDLFPMTVEGTGEKVWALIININPGNPNGGSGTQYFVGQFDGKNFNLDPAFLPYVQNGNGVWMDYGKDNYAGVTWSDVPAEDGRRLFIGWMSNWQYAKLVPTENWRNAMTVPWSLSMKKTAAGYRIFSNPVKELASLRQSSKTIEAGEVTKEVDLTAKHGFSPKLSELELEFAVPANATGKFGVELSNSKGERYRIGYDASAKQFFSDRMKAGEAAFSENFAENISVAPRFAAGEKLTMHLLFDVASAELFADGGATVMTEIFFPSEEYSQARLFAEGGAARLVGGKVHELRSIWK